MKKLMIILLVLMLSLGLSGVAYADTQNVSAKITGSLALTVPTELSNWVLTFTSTIPGEETANTTNAATAPEAEGPFAAQIVANCPYTVSVMVSQLPASEDLDTKMTSTNASTTTDLTSTFQLNYDTEHTAVTSGSSTFSILTDITTGSVTFLTAAEAPDDGYDYMGIKFGQKTNVTDPAYDATTQINYTIQLTWTASSSV